MLFRALLLPAVLLSALALAAPEAEASPVGGFDVNAYGGRVHVTGGVVIPIGERRRSRVTYTGGYYKTVYETRLERVWHEPELIGYDAHGHAVLSRGHFDEIEVQVPVRVWVPRRRVVHRRTGGARGIVRLGATIRIR